MIIVAMVGVASLIAVIAFVRWRSQRNAINEILAPIVIDGEMADRSALVWSLAAYGATDAVADLLLDRRIRSIEDVDEGLNEFLSTMSPDAKAQLAQCRLAAERADAERQLFNLQFETLESAATLGTLDAVIIALGENSDWLAAVAQAGAAKVGLGEEISQMLVSRHLPVAGLLPDAILTPIEHATQGVVDPTLDAVGDAALTGLSAIADAHIPVVTIGTAIVRARSAASAGLETSRVAENLALDIGVTGGGIAAGALIGTAVLPVVGTLVGGIIGSVLGRGIAHEVKTRHLITAQNAANDRIARLGKVVGQDRWLSVSADLAAVVSDLTRRHARFLARAEAGYPRVLVRMPRGALTVAMATETGEADLVAKRTELSAWDNLLLAVSAPDDAYARLDAPYLSDVVVPTLTTAMSLS